MLVLFDSSYLVMLVAVWAFALILVYVMIVACITYLILAIAWVEVSLLLLESNFAYVADILAPSYNLTLRAFQLVRIGLLLMVLNWPSFLVRFCPFITLLINMTGLLLTQVALFFSVTMIFERFSILGFLALILAALRLFHFLQFRAFSCIFLVLIFLRPVLKLHIVSSLRVVFVLGTLGITVIVRIVRIMIFS